MNKGVLYKSRCSLFVLLLLWWSASLLIAQETSSKALFTRLWTEIQNVVTPPAPTGTDVERHKPQEIFIMLVPGIAIDYEQYDDATWAKNNLEGPDPDLLKFEMTDAIPERASFFVDSGRKVSILYRKFLMNYINPKAQNTSLSEQTQEYRNALSKIFNSDYTKTDLVKTVESTRDTATETYARISSVRDECLRNEAPGVCAQKMLFYQAEVNDNTLIYMVTRKELQGAQATVLALQSRNLDNLLAQGMQKYFLASRSAVGGSTLFGTYLMTRYDPSDFYLWWSPTPTLAKSYKSAWAGVSIYETKSTATQSSNSMTRRVFESHPSKDKFFTVSNTQTSSSSNIDAFSSGSTFRMNFQLAQIRVYRQWFEPSLLEYYPLGLETTPLNEWSDGNYKGIFPWYISKVIVAKNITMQLDSFSQQMTEAFTAMSNDQGTAGGVGPFAMATSQSQSNSQRDKSFKFSASGGKLSIDGPQIIGYVVSRMPRFPNWEQEYSYQQTV